MAYTTVVLQLQVRVGARAVLLTFLGVQETALQSCDSSSVRKLPAQPLLHVFACRTPQSLLSLGPWQAGPAHCWQHATLSLLSLPYPQW